MVVMSKRTIVHIRMHNVLRPCIRLRGNSNTESDKKTRQVILMLDTIHLKFPTDHITIRNPTALSPLLSQLTQKRI